MWKRDTATKPAPHHCQMQASPSNLMIIIIIFLLSSSSPPAPKTNPAIPVVESTRAHLLTQCFSLMVDQLLRHGCLAEEQRAHASSVHGKLLAYFMHLLRHFLRRSENRDSCMPCFRPAAGLLHAPAAAFPIMAGKDKRCASCGVLGNEELN